jgi:hypothetical protein
MRDSEDPVPSSRIRHSLFISLPVLVVDHANG